MKPGPGVIVAVQGDSGMKHKASKFITLFFLRICESDLIKIKCAKAPPHFCVFDTTKLLQWHFVGWYADETLILFMTNKD